MNRVYAEYIILSTKHDAYERWWNTNEKDLLFPEILQAISNFIDRRTKVEIRVKIKASAYLKGVIIVKT